MISDGVDLKSILDITKKIFKKDLKLFNLNFENSIIIFFKKIFKNRQKIYLLQNF